MKNYTFLDKIYDMPLEALDEYVSCRKPIRFRCLKCGLVWSTRPTNILTGSGCPTCSKFGKDEKVVDRGEYVEVDISTKKHKNAIMKIDKTDWEYIEHIKKGKTSPVQTKHITYAVCLVDGKQQRIHRLLLESDLEAGMQVDHINHDGLDNRRCNIRPVTQSQNNMNSRLSSSNTSGIKGVMWDASKGRWLSFIKKDGKEERLGTFKHKELAIKARLDAEDSIHGEFAYNEARK